MQSAATMNGGVPGNRLRRRPALGLTTKISGLAAQAALISGAVIGLLTVRNSRDALQEQVLIDYQSQSDLAAEFTKGYFGSAQTTLEQLAAIPGLGDVTDPARAAALSPTLAIFQSIEPAFQNVSFEQFWLCIVKLPSSLQSRAAA